MNERMESGAIEELGAHAEIVAQRLGFHARICAQAASGSRADPGLVLSVFRDSGAKSVVLQPEPDMRARIEEQIPLLARQL